MKINVQIRHDNIIVPYSTDDINKIDEMNKDAIYVVEFGKTDTRSLQQNKLIHQFCKNIAIEAKKQNFKLKDLIKDGTEISMILVKELMFKKMCMSLYGKDSTTKLNKDELDLVFNSLILALGSYGMDTSKLLDR